MKSFRSKILTLLLVICFCCCLIGVADAYTVKQIFTRFAATAGETLTTGDVVTLKDADGYAYKADANDAALRPCVGVIGKGGASGSKVEVIVSGILSGWTGLTESGPGFMSETAAAVTQVAPAYSQQVGFAISTTEYFFNFQNYFDTSSLTALGSDVTITGTTPTLTIGDGDDEDTALIFAGQGGKNFYVGTDTTDDDLHIGYGITPGTQSAISITDAATPGVTIINSFSVNGNTTLGNAVTDSVSITGAIQGSLILDGTTDDANEVTFSLLDDPSADKTVKLPSKTDATIMISSLTTNDVDVANSIWGISNGLAFGGATGGDGFELQLKPQGDTSADKVLSMPVTNDAAVMVSTLTTNNVDVANSVWGVSNGLAFGGASGGDGFETTLTVADPTADRTVTIANATGTVNLNCTASHDYAGGAVAWTLSAAEMQCGAISVTNANGAIDAILPSAIPGKLYTIINGSGQTVTFKVTGQSGGTVATGKWALYTTIAADVAEVYELP